MTRVVPRPIGAIVVLAATLLVGPSVLFAKAPPSDRCALLPTSELQSVLAQSFENPSTSTAPSPYAGLPPGTDCTYSAGQSGGQVLFRIYVDPSAAIAKETFLKLSLFYPAKSKPPHLGDSAYIDTSDAIHVLKGSVRFYINVEPAAKAKQLVDLATFVSGQL